MVSSGPTTTSHVSRRVVVGEDPYYRLLENELLLQLVLLFV